MTFYKSYTVCVRILGTRTQRWVWCLQTPQILSRTAMKTGMAFIISVLSAFTSIIWDDTTTAHCPPGDLRRLLIDLHRLVTSPSLARRELLRLIRFPIGRSATISSKSLQQTLLTPPPSKRKIPKFNEHTLVCWLHIPSLIADFHSQVSASKAAWLSQSR